MRVISKASDDRTPKYVIVQEYIRNLIEAQSLSEGSRLPSENELVDELGISINTVKTGLNNLVSEGVIYREQGKGTFVGSTGVATKNPHNNARTIGVIVNDIFAESICSAIVRGAEKEADKNNAGILLANTDNRFDKAIQAVDFMIEKGASALIVMIPGSSNSFQKSYDYATYLKSKKVPIILVDRYLKGSVFDYVTSNNEHGGYLATDHIIKQSHKHIAFIGEEFCSTVEERITGFKMAHFENRVKYNEDNIIFENRNEDAGYKGVIKLLDQKAKVTAIVCVNDLVAVGAIKALTRKGLKVPDDIAVTGYDDCTLAAYCQVPLTTVRQSGWEMGKHAVKFCINHFAGKVSERQKIVLPVELIIRESTKSLANVKES